MKRVLIIAACTVAALFVIYACTRESGQNEGSPTTQATAFDELNSALDAYTANFYEEHEQVSTRSASVVPYNPNIPVVERKARGVWACDAGGAGIGAGIGALAGGGLLSLILGVIVGAFSSIVAAIAQWDYIVPDFNNNPSAYYYNLDNKDIHDQVGIAHNTILKNLLIKYDLETLKEATQDELFNMTVEEVKLLGYNTNNLPITAKNINLPYQEIQAAIFANDIDLATQLIVNACPYIAHEASAIKTLISTYLTINDKETGIEYVAGFRELVVNSAIPESSKNVIQAVGSTIVGSSNLWKENSDKD